MPEDSLTPPVHPLRRWTQARVGLARAGSSVSTADQLLFQLDHARARDAVHDTADIPRLAAELRIRGWHPLQLESAIPPGPAARAIYLRRPDLGRRLSPASTETLRALTPFSPPDLAFVLADGLSPLAIHRHALPLLNALDALLPDPELRRHTPFCLVQNGRVAIADEIGSVLQAHMAVLLIGERPGLTAPDSLGVYLTSDPRPGRTDADRNCISNIREEGTGYAEAARRIAALLAAARLAGGTGFSLKENGLPGLPASHSRTIVDTPGARLSRT